jgi:hypothetical protein
MRTAITILAFVCLSFKLTGQQKLPGAYIGWKSPIMELQTIGNKKQSCTIVMRADSIRVFLVEGNGTLSYLFNIPRLIYEDFLGGFFKNEKLYLFLNNGNNPGIRSFCYNFSDKNLIEQIIPFKINKKEERIIQRISSDNYFFYLTVAINSPELIVYKFNDGSQFDTHRFIVKGRMTNDFTNRQSSIFSKPVIDIEKVDMEGECDIETAKSKHKIYVQNDSLLLLLNNKKGVTDVFSFDLTANTINNRVIYHSRADDIGEKEVFNSFLFRNKVYYAAASLSNLLVQVNDFYTGKILQEFKAEKDSEIDFKNTIITKEGRVFYTEREVTSTKELLRKLSNGVLAITATAGVNEKEIQVQIGSLKEVNNGGGGGMMWGGGGGFATPGGWVSAAPIFMPTGGFYRAGWLKSARFKMLLNGETGAHLKGNMPLLINDKIDDYTKDIKIPKEGENLFVLNGNYYHIFYDKRERELSLVRF